MTITFKSVASITVSATDVGKKTQYVYQEGTADRGIHCHPLFNVCNGFHLCSFSGVTNPEELREVMVAWSNTDDYPTSPNGTKAIMIVSTGADQQVVREMLEKLEQDKTTQDSIGLHPQNCGPWGGSGHLGGSSANLWILRRSK